MVKRLLKCVREYKKQSLLTPLFVALEVMFECLIVYIMSLLIDSIYAVHMDKVAMYGGILVILAMLCLICGAIAGKYAAVAAAGFAKNIRSDIFFKIQKFSFCNIDKFSTASLVTRLTTDITNLQNAYMMIIRLAIRAPLMIVISFTIAATINWKLALIILAVIPILALAVFLMIKICMPVLDRLFSCYDKMNRTLRENIKAIRVVKSYVREDYESEKFRQKSDDVRRNYTIIERITALATPFMQMLIYTVITIISTLGAVMIINTSSQDVAGNILWGELSTGQLSSMVNYTMQIMMSLIQLTMVFVMIVMSEASTKRIAEVLDEVPTIQPKETDNKEVKDGSINFDHVSFKYSDNANRYALEDINLDIKSGETIGIIGGTGSSKSTLVQLIPRLYDVTSGSIKVGGIDVRDYDIHALREAVSVVLQKNILFTGTIKENLRWGNENATDEEIVEACKLAQADGFVRTFQDGYDTHIEQGGTNVSGGQKQRLCIARALLKKPKVLILDDSTSAVDTKTDASIREAFMEKIPNTTKLIISQRISSVRDADRIIVMDDGKVAGFGTHDELIKNNEIYADIYEIQTKLNKSEDSENEEENIDK